MAADRQLLLIAYYYPPAQAVGAIRPAKVARAFAEAGWKVKVIAAQTPDGPPEQSPGVSVTPVKPWPHARQLVAAMKASVSPSQGTAASTGSTQAERWTPPNPSLLKRFIFALMWLPDDHTGFIPPAVREGVRQAGPGTVVYTSGPPHSAHLTGWLIHLLTRRPLVMEYRDPWTGNHKVPWIRTAFTDAIDRWLERRCLASARLTVAVSEGIAHTVRRWAPPSRRIEIIRNGIDERAPGSANGAISGRPIRLLHLGTIYHGRDPRPLLRSMARLANERHREIELVFVGRARWFGTESIEGLAHELGLATQVRFQDWVPRAEGVRLAAEADALVLLAQEQPLQVPNKLYEYFGTGKPILAYVDRDGDCDRMLRAVGGHYVVTNTDPDDGEPVLAKLIDDLRAGTIPTRDDRLLGEWTSERQMAALVEAVGAVAIGREDAASR